MHPKSNIDVVRSDDFPLNPNASPDLRKVPPPPINALLQAWLLHQRGETFTWSLQLFI